MDIAKNTVGAGPCVCSIKKSAARKNNSCMDEKMMKNTKMKMIVCLFIIFHTLSASADLYERAPDVLPGTLPEMRTVEYWVARMVTPDEIILTVNQIQAMNDAYTRKISSPDPFKGEPPERIPNLSHWWPGYVMTPPDLRSMSGRAVADTVRAWIQSEIDYMRSKDFGNALAVKYSPRDLDSFEIEMALDRVDPSRPLRTAIAVRTSQVRIIPTFSPDQIGAQDNGKMRWDMFNTFMLKIANPATVLHRSASGEYLFVLTADGYGWVKSSDLAFGDDAETAQFTDPRDFVVCTGDRELFYTGRSCEYASGWFGMGDRLPVSPGGNGREILIPFRMPDGSLTAGTVWLAGDADVNRGWLPYTRRNIVTTAFKLLDNAYDFTGAWFGRHHETTYRDIFAVFGFRLPWHGGLFTHFGQNDSVMLKDIGKEAQYRTILENEPFVTVQNCGGHSQLLLGENNGVPIVFDQHGYGYTDTSGVDVEIRRCCVGTVNMPTYFLTRNVTFLNLK
jgi:hypothetical protein